MNLPFGRNRRPVCITQILPTAGSRLANWDKINTNYGALDAKANKEMAEKAKGKGPLNAGQQGIKKSGKK